VLPTVNNLQRIMGPVENQLRTETITPPLRDGDPDRHLNRAVPRRARVLAVVVTVLAVVGAVVGVVASSSSGARPAPSAHALSGKVTTASVATFKRAMIAKLEGQKAHFFWVVCVPSGAHFRGVRVVRCNVDFGDPHIQAYCSVFRGGRLVTSADDPAIPCGPDDAGYSQAIQTWN
jgi:hypothetical protein